MSTTNPDTRPEAVSPETIYKKCMARDKNVRETNLAAVLESFFKQLVFDRALFAADPQLVSAVETDPDSRHSKILLGVRDGAKYRDLLELVKHTPNKEIRWLVLAMWLKTEGVCEPEEFLPFRWRAHARKYFRGLSLADIRYATLVDIWRPYFERLMEDLRALPPNLRRVTEELKKRGYETSAIECARTRRSPIPAICKWLAPSENVDATTFRNAYSRSCSARDRIAAAQASGRT